MASSKAPLTFQVKGYPFVGQELVSDKIHLNLNCTVPDLQTWQTLADHSSSIPNSISQDVLFALPYIGLLVGIDELTPSNAVYGIYDSSHHGLRFVRGDGIFIPQHQVCFLKLFNDGSSQHSSQRAYFRELVRRSAIHCYSTKNARFAADCRNTFPTLGMIKSTLLMLAISNLEAVQLSSLAKMTNAVTHGKLHRRNTSPLLQLRSGTLTQMAFRQAFQEIATILMSSICNFVQNTDISTSRPWIFSMLPSALLVSKWPGWSHSLSLARITSSISRMVWRHPWHQSSWHLLSLTKIGRLIVSLPGSTNIKGLFKLVMILSTSGFQTQYCGLKQRWSMRKQLARYLFHERFNQQIKAATLMIPSYLGNSSEVWNGRLVANFRHIRSLLFLW